MILQILNLSENKKATFTQISNEISQVLDEDVADAGFESSLKRVLKQLQNLGIVKYLKMKRCICYALK